ncbi:MAG: hypothetical protein ACKVWR_17365 [Acidimicrobiales bacterium]
MVNPLPAGRPITVVEDSDDDFGVLVRLYRRIDAELGLRRARTGDELLAELDTTAVLPLYILLDLNLPGSSGVASGPRWSNPPPAP